MHEKTTWARPYQPLKARDWKVRMSDDAKINGMQVTSSMRAGL